MSKKTEGLAEKLAPVVQRIFVRRGKPGQKVVVTIGTRVDGKDTTTEKHIYTRG